MNTIYIYAAVLSDNQTTQNSLLFNEQILYKPFATKETIFYRVYKLSFLARKLLRFILKQKPMQ